MSPDTTLLTAVAQDFKIRADILSTPVAFLLFKDAMVFFYLSTTNRGKVKCLTVRYI